MSSKEPPSRTVRPIKLTVPSRRVTSRFKATPLLFIYVFIGAIGLGTALLIPSFTNTSGNFTPPLTALFTATSAITVTGLTIEETSLYWTRTGQLIILAMIYIGGLGFMTMATFLLIIIGQRVTLAQRLIIRESLMVDQLGSMVRLTIGIVIVATLIQLVGFAVLISRFYWLYPLDDAIWQALFHSISAFNGAGFVIFETDNQLIHFVGDYIVMGTLGTLIFIGALSYLVIVDITRRRRLSLLSLNTKLVLTFTLILTAISISAFLALEFNNPHTIGTFTTSEKFIASVFQGISGRTAGFTTSDLAYANESTNLIYSALMFIGGASASVAGGLKVNTFAVIAIGIFATLKGRENTRVFNRELSPIQVNRAMVIGAVSLAFVLLVILILTITEPETKLSDIIFETTSAFGTVGLSKGITSQMSSIGHILLIITMLIGKLGPLTIGISMAQNTRTALYRYPQERVTIG